MPKETRFAIRMALIMLVIGATLGAVIMCEKGGLFQIGATRLLGAHIEILLFGWLIQLAIGVAVWMLPKFDGVRGREGLAVAAVVLLNLGVATSVMGFVLTAPPAVVIGRLIEAAGGVAFVSHAWRRVKPFGAL